MKRLPDARSALPRRGGSGKDGAIRTSSRKRTVVGGLLLSAALLFGVVGSGVTTAGAAGAPPTVANATVSAIGTTAAMLSGSLDPDGADTQAWFEYGLTPAFGSLTPAQDVGSGIAPVTISASLSGLAPGTTYYVRLDAQNANGTADGPVSPLTTSGQTPPPPTSPPLPPPTSPLPPIKGSPPTTSPPATGGRLTMMKVRDNRVGAALTAVSCPVASACWAVGGIESRSFSSGHLAIDRYQAGSWVSVPAPALPGSGLSGIDCTSTASCWAVGAVEVAGGSYPIALHYNGRTWATVPIPTPPGTFAANYLSAVDCTSTASCWAVGGIDGATSKGAPLVEHWNGLRWSVEPSPNPSNDSLLSAVSCSSSNSCWAVGVADDASSIAGVAKPLLVHWNGQSWSRAAVAAPADAGPLSSVSCRWVTACFAVNSSVLFRLSGGVWRSGFSPGAIDAVSCSTPSRCWGVGSEGAEYWNGTRWLRATVPNPPPSQVWMLNAITCGTGPACVAVGTRIPAPIRTGIYSSRVLAEKTSAP